MVSPSLSTRGGLTPATEAYAAFCSARRVQMYIRRLVRISRLPCATGTWVLCLGIEAHLQFGIRFRVEYAQLGKFHAFPVCPRLLVFHDMNMKPTMVSTAAIGGAGKPSLLDYSTTIGLVGGGILRI